MKVTEAGWSSGPQMRSSCSVRFIEKLASTLVKSLYVLQVITASRSNCETVIVRHLSPLRRFAMGTVVVLSFASMAIAPPTSARASAPPSQSFGVIGQTLFRDIVTNNFSSAATLFFPEAAYVRMKTGHLANPSADFNDRLLAFYRLDFAAYHQVAAGVTPHYLRTLWLPGAAALIGAGVCENGVAYWHEPAIRIVYQQGTIVKSFAVDSLISWGDRWYIIHLGPNPRPANVGTVDAPTVGPGIPGPAGGC